MAGYELARGDGPSPLKHPILDGGHDGIDAQKLGEQNDELELAQQGRQLHHKVFRRDASHAWRQLKEGAGRNWLGADVCLHEARPSPARAMGDKRLQRLGKPGKKGRSGKKRGDLAVGGRVRRYVAHDAGAVRTVLLENPAGLLSADGLQCGEM